MEQDETKTDYPRSLKRVVRRKQLWEKDVPIPTTVEEVKRFELLMMQQEKICVRYGCWRAPLKYMKAGESHQTDNGFFTILIAGWYCPKCGGGYGGPA